MLDTITDTLQPIVVETLLTVILGAIAWLMRKLPARMQIEIEAKHRAALHSALETGTAYAFDVLETALRTNPAIAASDATVGQVLDYVERSVPDALKRLAPSRAMLEAMARAKINEALTRLGAGKPVKPADDGWRAPHVPTTPSTGA